MTPIAQGQYKGVNWRSLNFIEQMPEIVNERAIELNHLLEHGFSKPFHEIATSTMYEYLNRKLTDRERRKLYISKALYRNNYRVFKKPYKTNRELLNEFKALHPKIYGFSTYDWRIIDNKPLTVRCTVRTRGMVEKFPILKIDGFKQTSAYCIEDDELFTRVYFRFARCYAL
jgi:hypothetical protein